MNFKKTLNRLVLIAAITLSTGLPVWASYVIPDSGVTTTKIANAAITQAKLAARATGTSVGAGGVAISASSGGFSTSSASLVDVTNLSVTITTTGRPVRLELAPDAAGAAGASNRSTIFNGSGDSRFKYFRGATDLGEQGFHAGASGEGIPIGAFSMTDFPPAGTYVYKLQVGKNTGGTTVDYVFLIAFEL